MLSLLCKALAWCRSLFQTEPEPQPRSKKRPRIWIYDLDDTLMWNSYTYSRSFILLNQFLVELFNNRILYAGSIARHQEDVDKGLTKEINPRTGKPYGFSRYRFPESFVRTYRWLCEEKGFGKYDEVAAEQCREFGMRAFEESNYRWHGLIPDAERLLNSNRRDGCPQILVTKGDEWVQNKKIRALNLQWWFKEENRHIVDEKTPALFLGILASFPGVNPSDVVMVGNSLSDIEPALAAGLRAIYIPCPTWEGENMKPRKLTKDEQNRLVVFETIKEVLLWKQSLEP